MKKFILILCFSVFFISSFSQGYIISGEIKNMQDTTAILAYYFGGKQYATDTTDVVKGKLTFSGDKELEGGIYLIVLPGGKYFELIISEQKFSFTTDKNDLVQSMRFQNSRENTAFYEYLNYITEKQNEVSPLKEKQSNAKSEEEKEKIQQEIAKVDEDVRSYRNIFNNKYPNVFFSKIIRATTDIVIPESPLIANKINMERRGGVWTIPCEINGIEADFIYDTGANDVFISLDFFSVMVKQGNITEKDILGEESFRDASGNINKAIKFNIRNIKIGNTNLRNIEGSVSDNMSTPLLLGQTALNKLGEIKTDLEKGIFSFGDTKENFSFYYYKKHFWENMDFSDQRMLRTPIFFNKMDQYLEKLSPKHPDSIIVSADIMVEKARANKEVFQYVVSYITSTYERSKIMGMDAVFVHMVEKYYITGECDWVKEKQLKKIIERANRISPNMIGKKPLNLVFKDPMEKYHSLYHLQAKYTLLFFYDPDCGHCKKETPKVKAVCDSLVDAGIDIKVFAVNTEFDIEKWKEFIKKFDVGNWINVGDIQFDKEGNPVATSNWREQYDIHSTPVIYLLDKDKKIIAKRINDKQIVKVIEREEEGI